jgi:hypothetical protein
MTVYILELRLNQDSAKEMEQPITLEVRLALSYKPGPLSLF